MDDNVMRVLQMLQDGKISAQEAEILIAALRGETRSATATEEKEKAKEDDKDDKTFSFGFEKIKTPKIDLDNLGERISKAVSKVQPEKIVRRVQAQVRTATRAGAHWGATVTARVRTWTEGEDTRPENPGGMAEHSETHDFDNHLDPSAAVFIENPLGNVKVIGVPEGRASIKVVKTVWAARSEDLRALAERMTVNIHGTDTRLDIKADAPEYFRDGTVDLEIRVPRGAQVRVSGHFGDVELSQLDGRVEAATTTGNLKMLDLGGDARAETASGNLSLERINGIAVVATQSGDIVASDIRRGLSANTASGDVTAAKIEGGQVECKSVSGDVQVEQVGTLAPLDITVESVSGDVSLTNASGNIALKAVSGDVIAHDVTATLLQAQTVSGDVQATLREVFSGTMQASTLSGDVTLALIEGSNLRVSLSTTSGELRCEHDVHNVIATETLWSGQMGTGAGTLNVQTVSGDILIRRA